MTWSLSSGKATFFTQHSVTCHQEFNCFTCQPEIDSSLVGKMREAVFAVWDSRTRRWHWTLRRRV